MSLRKDEVDPRAGRSALHNSAIMASPYRYEVDRDKGWWREDCATPCDIKLFHNTILSALKHPAVEEIIIDKAELDRIENEEWRRTVDEKRAGVKISRLNREAADDMRLERKVNIMVRREALRHLLEEEWKITQQDLYKKGLSFSRHILDYLDTN